MKYKIFTTNHTGDIYKYVILDNLTTLCIQPTSVVLIIDILKSPSTYYWSSLKSFHMKYLTPLFEFNTIEEFEKEFM